MPLHPALFGSGGLTPDSQACMASTSLMEPSPQASLLLFIHPHFETISYMEAMDNKRTKEAKNKLKTGSELNTIHVLDPKMPTE